MDPATGLATVPAGAGYDEFAHTGRINYVNEPAVQPAEPSEPVVTEPSEPTQPTQPIANTHVVVKGDNLSKLALKYLGNANKWKVIYEANKSVIKDPNLIYVGQTLTIPQ